MQDCYEHEFSIEQVCAHMMPHINSIKIQDLLNLQRVKRALIESLESAEGQLVVAASPLEQDLPHKKRFNLN